MVEVYGHALPKPSPGPTVDSPKDLLHREFGNHDRGTRELFPVRTARGNRAQTRV